jgi:hypothetical protein
MNVPARPEGLKTDKRSAVFSIRIPEITAINLEKLSSAEKSSLNNDILKVMARHIHNCKNYFDEEMYLFSGNEED